MSNKIFISYSHKDKVLVDTVARKLEKVFGKNNIFYDSWSMQPGDSIIGKMNQGLEEFTTFFFFVSSNSLDSNMVRLEWQVALNRAVNNELNFVAVRIEDCTLPAILSDKQYIDLYGEGIDIAIDKMKAVSQSHSSYVPLEDFQNLVALATRLDENVVQIKVEALQFSEDNPEIVFACNNEIDYSDVCFDVEYGYYVINSKQIKNEEGKILNALSVGLQRQIKPGFPYFFRILFNTTNKYEGVILYRLTNKTNGTLEQIPLINEMGVEISNLIK